MPAPDTERLPRRPFTGPTPVHPLLQLQRQIGNRAVTSLMQRGAGGPAPGVATPPLTVQRRESSAKPPAASPPAEAQVAELVNAELARLPALEADAVVAPGQAEEARQEAGAVGNDLPALGIAAQGPLADWQRNELGNQGGAAAAPVVAELVAARGEVDLPAPAKPGIFSRALSSVKGFFSSAGTAIKGAFSRENVHDAGAKTQAAGGIAAPVTGHVSDFATAGQHIVDNPATEGAAKLVGGAGAAGKVQQTGSQMGQVAHSATPTTPTMEHPGEFAHSFTSGAFELTHQIASVVGIFFSAIKAGVDIRSLVSSIRIIRGLKAAKRSALANGASPEIVAAVDYAIRQKYEKVIKRAIGAAAALAALGVGLAILIANPVGASLAAIIIGGVGAAVFMYKLGRWAWKKWKTKSVGEKRKEMARRLYEQIREGNALAREAVRALHLDPQTVAAAPDGAALIARKLKSA